MRGSTKKRGGKWTVILDEGRGADGRRRQRWISGFATKASAQARLTELLAARATGAYVPPSKNTVAAFMAQWLDARRSQLRPSTMHGYTKIVRAYIVPKLGAVELQALTPPRINAFYQWLLEHGRRDGKGGLSGRSIGHVHRVLHRAMRDAVRWRALSSNPVDLADPPKAQPTTMKTWTPAELRAFLDAMAHDRLIGLWTLAATTGARRGELLGLRWQDVDLDRGRVSIVQTLNDVDNKLVIGEPKTARSKRTISLDATTVEALRAHRRNQQGEIMAFGRADWPAHGLTFTTEIGEPIRPAWLTRAFQQRVKSAGVPKIRLHDLRHTCASIMLAAGVPAKMASERLGHSSIAITLDTYSHVLLPMEQDAADKLGAMVFGR